MLYTREHVIGERGGRINFVVSELVSNSVRPLCEFIFQPVSNDVLGT